MSILTIAAIGLLCEPSVKDANVQHLYRTISTVQEMWPEILAKHDEHSGPRLRAMSTMVGAAPSAIHGRGVFSTAPIAQGTVVTFYPVDALGDAEKMLCLRQWPTLGARDYKVEIFHSLLQGWAEDLWIDADPAKELVAGWLGHLVNDATMCASSEQAEIARYYRETAARENCALVPFGDACPIMSIVTTRDVDAGVELLQAYSHDYWTQDADYTPETLRVAQARAEDKMAAAQSVATAYAAEIEALSAVLIDTLPHRLQEVTLPASRLAPTEANEGMSQRRQAMDPTKLRKARVKKATQKKARKAGKRRGR